MCKSLKHLQPPAYVYCVLAFRALFLSVRAMGQASSLAGFGCVKACVTSQCA